MRVSPIRHASHPHPPRCARHPLPAGEGNYLPSSIILSMTRPLPTISLVIPMFNEEMNIEHAIDCAVEALSAHSRDYEIIIVDDTSTDRSPRLVAEAAAANP